MSIHFISGKPGAGKSRYAMKLIADEIMYGFRPVLTNVPVKMGELNAYLQERFGQAFLKALMRRADISRPDCVMPCLADIVTVFEDEEMAGFFTFRGDSVRLNRVGKEAWRNGERTHFDLVRDSGVMYVLDEVHIAFNARAWAETGPEYFFTCPSIGSSGIPSFASPRTWATLTSNFVPSPRTSLTSRTWASSAPACFASRPASFVLRTRNRQRRTANRWKAARLPWTCRAWRSVTTPPRALAFTVGPGRTWVSARAVCIGPGSWLASLWF